MHPDQLAAAACAWILAVCAGLAAAAETQLCWTAPTRNVDGTELVDLASYRIVWGSSSRTYTDERLIPDPAVECSVVGGLEPGARYYFAMTAINAAGDESAYSNEILRTVAQVAPGRGFLDLSFTWEPAPDMPLLGKATAGLSNTAVGNPAAARLTTPAGGVIVAREMNFYVAGNTATRNVRGAIYSSVGGEPSALIAESNDAAVCTTTPGWHRVTFDPLDLQASTEYWFALLMDGTINIYHDAGTANQARTRNSAASYPTWPDPFGATTGFALDTSINLGYGPSQPDLLTTGIATTGASFTTGSISPAANALLLAVMASHGGASRTHDSVTSTFGTVAGWTKRADIAGGFSQGNGTLSLWSAIASASPGSGTVTFNASGNHTSWAVQVTQVRNGFDAETPVQSGTAQAGATTAPSGTFPGAPVTGNLLFSTLWAFGGNVGTGGATPGAGWIELADIAPRPTHLGQTQAAGGSNGSTFAWSGLDAGVTDSLMAAVEIAAEAVAGAVTVNPGEVNQLQVLDAPGITQDHQLAPGEVNQLQVLDAPSVSVEVTVSPAELDQLQVLDAPAITQDHQLAPGEVNQLQVLDGVSVTQDHQLAPGEVNQLQVLDLPSIIVTGQVDPVDVAQLQVLDGVSVTQDHQLAPGEVNQLQVLDAPSVTQDTLLAPLDLAQLQALDAVTLIVTATLTPVEVNQLMALDGVAIVQDHQVTAVNVFQAQVLGLPSYIIPTSAIPRGRALVVVDPHRALQVVRALRALKV